MEGKVVTGILAAAGAALLVTSVAVLKGQDKTPPVIKVGKAEISYTEGNDYKELLADVSAEDNRDKDVTENIFIDRIVTMKDGKHATVVYAVIDEHKNVATAERKVKYITKAKKADTKETDTKETDAKEADKKESEEIAKKAQAEDIDTETTESEEETGEEEQGELVPNGTSPAIRMTEHKATVKKGGMFDALSYVENAVDDEDDKTELYRHIHIDGQYNTKVPGTYTLKYYVTDSAGNTSNIETFSLTVE